MRNLKRNKIFALSLGIILLVFYVYNRINPIDLSSLQQIAQGQIINFFVYLMVRIISAGLCVSIAKGLSRNQIVWGIFGFILPPISLIIIYLLSEKKVKGIEQGKNISNKIIYETSFSVPTYTPEVVYNDLSELEKSEADKFINYGIKPGEKLIINKKTREIDRLDINEWKNLMKQNRISDYMIILEK